MDPPADVNWHAGVDLLGPDGHPDLLGNDTLGDCVPVAALRAAQMRAAHALGSGWKPGLAQAQALYGAWSGWDGTQGTDQGTDTAAAMAAWVKSGIDLGNGLLDCGWWCRVDPAQARQVQLAIALSGPVQVTFDLPLAAQDLGTWDLTGDGESWAPGSWGAHRVACGRYPALDGSFIVLSWGLEFHVSPAFWTRYVLAVDATLAPATWLDAAGMAPSGVDREALIADAAVLTG